MGLPIDSMHAPSISAQATPQSTEDAGSLEQLMSRKKEMEEELDALGDVLKSHGVNMNTGLTTFDGFPRADIDVAQIRTARSRIVYLRNDHKALMSRIEKELHSHFATSNANASASAARLIPASTSQTGSFSQATFARVNSVAPESPAEAAGLRPGDRIQSFGEANWLNNDKLRKVADVVNQNEGRQVVVKVRRADETLSLTLVPRSNWGGRGMLGCHLLAD